MTTPALQPILASRKPEIALSLRAVLAFTYGFVLLRLYESALAGIVPILREASDVHQLVFAFATPRSRLLLDPLGLSVLLIMLFLQYYVVAAQLHRSTFGNYWMRHLFLDLALSFSFYASAQSLLRARIQPLFEQSDTWLGIMAIAILSAGRFVLVRLPDESSEVDVARLRTLQHVAVSWQLTFSGFVYGVWWLEKAKFDAVRTIDAIVFGCAMFLLVGMGASAFGRRVGRAWALSVPLAVTVLTAVSVLALYWFGYAWLTGLIVAFRHRLALSWVLVVGALGFLIIAASVDVDRDVAKDVGGGLRLMRRGVARLLFAEPGASKSEGETR